MILMLGSTSILSQSSTLTSSITYLVSTVSMIRETSLFTSYRGLNMNRGQADLWVTATVAVLACAAGALGAPVAVMIMLGIPLFAAPGYLLGQMLLSPDRT